MLGIPIQFNRLRKITIETVRKEAEWKGAYQVFLT